MKQSGRRRGFKSWFVEPYLQVKLGLMFLLLNLVFAGLTFGVFGFYIWDIYQTMQVYFQLTSDQSSEIMSKFQTPILVGAVLILVFVATSILVAVRYTHRIYGPLVSIHRFLDDYIQGQKATPLVLRESDQLQELAEKLNLIVEMSTGDRRQNLRPFYRYIDELLEGKDPDAIRLRDSDQFQGLADRLNRLGEKMRSTKAG